MRFALWTAAAGCVLALALMLATSSANGQAKPRCEILQLRVQLLSRKEARAERALSNGLRPSGARPAKVAGLQHTVALQKYRLALAKQTLKHCH